MLTIVTRWTVSPLGIRPLLSITFAVNEDLVVTGRTFFAATWFNKLELSEDRCCFDLFLVVDARNDQFSSILMQYEGCGLLGVDKCFPVGKTLGSAGGAECRPGFEVVKEEGLFRLH